MDEDGESVSPRDPAAWAREGQEWDADYRIFRVRRDRLRSPRTGELLERVVLEAPGWVNVVARTDEGRILFVRQYRFGREALTTEIPGGMVDPGEDPLEAARRELREETGYEAERWLSLGRLEPNPAMQDNLCHLFLALGARPVGDLRLDPGEDIRVLSLTPEEVRRGVREGEIRHCIVVAALSRVLDLRLDLPVDVGTPEA